MNNDSRSDPSITALRQWRRTAVLFISTTTTLLLGLAVVAWLAVQSLSTHYNLYYLLWKAGIRPYEQSIVFSGLYHDQSYRQQFIGMTVNQFQQEFPNTFYKILKLPPSAKANQEYYIDDFRQAQSQEGVSGIYWQAIFEDGRLIDFDVSKG